MAVYLRGSGERHSGVSKYGRKWAGWMHWVAILDYRNISGNEQIFVSDSAFGNSGWYPLDEFDGMICSATHINEK